MIIAARFAMSFANSPSLLSRPPANLAAADAKHILPSSRSSMRPPPNHDFTNMTNSRYLRYLQLLLHAAIAFFLLTIQAAVAQSPAKQSAPNFVVVLCDDLGYGDLGCYGHPHIKTPNLDALAEKSLRLTACYSSAPVCSPSRVGLLTGRSPNRAGVYDWIPAASPDRPRPDQRHQVHMRASEATIAQVLKQAGYNTCAVGKWHCNSMFNHAAQPQPGDFGFEHWFATQNNAAPTHQNPNNFVRNGKAVGALEGFSCQLVVDEAIQWLDGQADNDKPFFLFTAFHEPHEPVASPPALVEQYKDVARNEDEAQYFANVANVDLAVGRLIKHLKQLGKWENTLLVFTSDNGPETLKRYRGAQRSYGRPTPLRGMKLWTTEAGFRVAGIVSWPGHIQPKESSEAVSALDLLPTFCSLAGANLPSRELDGVDLSQWLQHSGTLERPQPLVWCYYNAINQQRVAMRDGPWKMLAKLDGNLPKLQNVHPGNLQKVQSAKLTNFELYRIGDDIAEQRNLFDPSDPASQRLQANFEAAYQRLLQDSPAWLPPKAEATSK